MGITLDKVGRGVIAASVAIMLLVHLGFFFSAGKGSYMGIPFNAIDNNTYFSFIGQVKEGHLLFTNRFTPEKVPYILFRPEFLAIGMFSLLLGPLAAYYLFKVVFLVLFIYITYRMISHISKENERQVVLAFVLLGSGIGYMFSLLYDIGFKRINSSDLLYPESSFVSSMIAPVHVVMSLTLMVLVFYLYHRHWESRSIWTLVASAFLNLLLGFIHLFDSITLIFVFGMYMLYRIQKRKTAFADALKANLIFGLISLPAFAYTYYLYAMVPELASWNSQNVLTSPPFHNMVFGYLIPLALAIVYGVYLYRSRKNQDDMVMMLIFWVVAGFILMYMPLNIQVRFMEGLFIPVMMLGALGFERVVVPVIQRVSSHPRMKLTATAVILILITPSSAFWVNRVYMAQGIDKTTDYFIPTRIDGAEIEAMRWLDENTDPEDVVISGYKAGNYIPRISGNRVFLGHWAQTIDYTEKKAIVERFFKQGEDPFRQEAIDEYGIRYVYQGPDEKALGQDETLSGFRQAFNNGVVTIYEVI